MVSALNAQRLVSEYAVNGKPLKLQAVAGTGIYPPPRYNKTLRTDGGGFDEVMSTTACILKSDWPAYTSVQSFEKKVVQLPNGVGWQGFRIVATTDLITRGEWRLELEALM